MRSRILNSLITLILVGTTAGAHAATFDPIQCVRNSIVPADLTLNYGGGTVQIVLDEDVQIQELLRDFTEVVNGTPTETQVFKIIIDTASESQGVSCISGDHFLMSCTSVSVLRFLDSEEKLIQTFEHVMTNLTSQFTTSERLAGNGTLLRDEKVEVNLDLSLNRRSPQARRQIPLTFSPRECQYL